MIYRQGRNYENLNRVIFDGTGIYDIPRLRPVDTAADSFIGFNYAKSCKVPESKGVHFFIDDYQFVRLWTNPDAYLELLRRFKCVCTPDFSTYTDFPKAIQIYNHYRKHWLGGVVAVSSVGTQMNADARALFMAGYNEMLARLEPSAILFYGSVPDGCKGNIIPLATFQEGLKKRTQHSKQPGGVI